MATLTVAASMTVTVEGATIGSATGGSRTVDASLEYSDDDYLTDGGMGYSTAALVEVVRTVASSLGAAVVTGTGVAP